MKLDKGTTAEVLRCLTEIARGEFSVSDDELLELAQKDELAAELFMGLQMLHDTIQFQHQKLKDSEQKLRKEKELVEQSMIYKDQFLANMSHEIRTPLNGIIGLNSVLLKTELTSEQKRLVQNIQGSGDSLLVIINDILDFSKIEAGKIELVNKAFSLKALLSEVETLFLPQFEDNELLYEVEILDVEHDLIVSDAIRLKQILINLIGNAVKFTHLGKVKLVVSSNKNQLFFEVIDSGIGIPEDKLGTIFNSFDQVDNTVSRKFGGTGLGLSITKSLIELLGGDMTVESEVGRGTNFKFSIDYEVGESLEIVDGFSFNYDFTGLKVLVAEDNEVNQQVIGFLLKQIGVEFDLVENGKLAVELIKTKQYDVVLMDIQMPVMDGLTATSTIRSLSSKIDQPYIVVLTANAYKKDEERYYEEGMNNFVTKPIDKNLLEIVLYKAQNLKS